MTEQSKIIAELRRRAAIAQGEEPVLTVRQKVEALFETYGIRLVDYQEGRTESGELLVQAHPHINDLYTAPPFTVDQLLQAMLVLVGGECFYNDKKNAFTSRLISKKTLQQVAEAMTATKDEQIENLQEMLESSDILVVMLKRALQTILLELPDRRAEVEIDISDLEIPDAPKTTRFFLNEDGELDME